MRDYAGGGAAFRGRHPPAGRRGADQHVARRRAALADILVRIADAATAAGREIPPDALARRILPGRRVFGRDFGPVAFQLLGDELREAGQRALAHLRARDPDHHRVVRANDHPGIHLRCAVGGLRAGEAERDPETERQPATDRCGAGKKRAAIDLR